MAYVRNQITGVDLAALNLDKPILLADHPLRAFHLGSNTGGRWNQTGNPGDADETASGFSVYRGYDGHARSELVTKPDADQLTWYYTFNVSADPITFDTLFLYGPNLAGFGIELQIADDAAHTSNNATIAQIIDQPYAIGEATAAKRNVHAMLGAIDLGKLYSYTAVEYVRLKFTINPADTPEVSEFWLGSRRQLLFHPDLPHGNLAERSGIDQARTRPGLTTADVHRRGQATRELVASVGTSDELDPFTGWWQDSGRGQRSFVYIELPSTAPKGYLMAADADAVDFNPALEEGLARRPRIPMRELDPLRSQD